jgi:hypothetical protein
MDAQNIINGHFQEREHDLRRRQEEEYREVVGLYYDQLRDARGAPHNDDLQVGPNCFTSILQNVVWPAKFRPIDVDKCDGTTYPHECLGCYETAIKAACEDSFVMANIYLPICLASALSTWLMVLPADSVPDVGSLCRVFIRNIMGTYKCPGNEWDLLQVVQ